MKTSDFFYDLPEELIAQFPVTPRDNSRLLAFNKETGEIFHRHFYDIGEFLRDDDLLVINNTRVIPARLFGEKINKKDDESIDGQASVPAEHGDAPKKGAAIEILLLKRIDYERWEAIARPAKKVRPGTEIKFGDKLTGIVEAVGENGIRVIRFKFEGVFEDILNGIGVMPLPPYIKATLQDKERYQTVYSKIDGSAAAPTAGFHFTDGLISTLKGRGIEFAEVLLHIGLSTFRPVKADNIEEHKMHTEYYEISKAAAEQINRAKREGRRVVAVGTTSVRTLESAADSNGFVKPCAGTTDIFIYPSYKFKTVDALITNFHLPESTLVMLVSAFAGQEETLRVYREAVKEKYRFFSFGDSSMFF